MEADFLLKTELARRLYHGCAETQPIIDYHNHLSAADLAADRRYANLTELWVAQDPYKHRAMRIAGVPEARITGRDASPREKFEAWASTVPQTLGNPLYHWTALELDRVFHISEPLTPESAGRIWDCATERLREPGFSARGLLQRFRAESVCTSDGLLDSLEAHRALARSDFGVRVLPSLRGDDLVAAEPEWLVRLADVTGTACDSFGGFCSAVKRALDDFDLLGCRLADHALDAFGYAACAESEADVLLRRRMVGETLSGDERLGLRSAVLRFLGQEYGRRGWRMQLHLNAQRRTSARLRRLAGPAGGYATAGNALDAAGLCAFLDDLERAGALPRTILYTLNPADNAVLAVLTGSFAEDGVSGKIQFGPAWWYNDHIAGIRHHMEALSGYGLLSTFIGMTTDSRSPLSMVRHEYFRRVLCATLGEWAEREWVPDDFPALAELVRKISYGNAKSMMG
ncbi:MAG: glucuronate isomerase [Kiritimatiellia bacterium]|jgi:glucuronate isomerase|nr:glucuronate isomerase [Kiritimatiellia bacterium]